MLSVCPSHLGYSDNKLILDQNLEGGKKKKRKKGKKKRSCSVYVGQPLWEKIFWYLTMILVVWLSNRLLLHVHCPSFCTLAHMFCHFNRLWSMLTNIP